MKLYAVPAPDGIVLIIKEMIAGMVAKYPDADVFLFTLVYTTDSVAKPDDVMYFNEVIEQVAAKYGLPVVDLFHDSGITKDTMAANMGDGDLHPDYAGMDKITECFISALIGEYLS